MLIRSCDREHNESYAAVVAQSGGNYACVNSMARLPEIALDILKILLFHANWNHIHEEGPELG